MEHNNTINYDYILIRFGELSTKGKNKKDFIKKLLHNIKNALRNHQNLSYERTHDRLYIYLNNESVNDIILILKNVFGISSYSLAKKIKTNLNEIKNTSLAMISTCKGKTFKIDTRRSWKQFEMNSDSINREVAAVILQNTELKVNVKEPDIRLAIEIHQESTYLMFDRYKGAGGYPVGVGGKALVMLSGGIDSPVAAYLTMKRGIAVECIHYASPPYTSQQAREKVLDLARKLAPYQGHVRVHMVPFTPLQLEIYKQCDESYAITIMRRMMYRIASQLLEKTNCLAIVNGESIGQVASQTLDSMQVINDVCNQVVLRPLCSFDKLEIIDIAKRIDTYNTSILPYEDCCTIFTPKNPVTRPNLEKAKKMEQRFDFDSFIRDCIANTESIDVYPEQTLEEFF